MLFFLFSSIVFFVVLFFTFMQFYSVDVSHGPRDDALWREVSPTRHTPRATRRTPHAQEARLDATSRPAAAQACASNDEPTLAAFGILP